MRYNAPAEGHAIAMLSYLANPARFMRISGVALPWLGASSLVVLALGLVWSLLLAPPDYQQGESVRIMFIHVPAAWMALSVYLFVAIASAVWAKSSWMWATASRATTIRKCRTYASATE